MTGLFGFLRWDVTFANGAWSIGNELVFYSVFPLILYCSRRNKGLLIGLLSCAAAMHHYFAFHILNPAIDLANQWRDYVNPLNQVFFFIAGCGIGLFTKRKSVSPIASSCFLLCGLMLFTLTPADGNTIHLVSGWNRWIFTVSCLLICLGTYKINVPLPSKLHSALQLLGESSYSVYLLHAMVFAVWAFMIKLLVHQGIEVPIIIKVVIPIAATLKLSYWVYNSFEKYFIRLGNKLNGVDSK
jgi:peptidoglycan/LPS O-acetylase OafA/YrhL